MFISHFCGAVPRVAWCGKSPPEGASKPADWPQGGAGAGVEVAPQDSSRYAELENTAAMASALATLALLFIHLIHL